MSGSISLWVGYSKGDSAPAAKGPRECGLREDNDLGALLLTPRTIQFVSGRNSNMAFRGDEVTLEFRFASNCYEVLW